MTSAIRPRTGNTVPVCVNCQSVYSKNQFMNGVDFQ